MRFLMILALSGTLGLLGCGSGSDGTGGSPGTGGMGGAGGATDPDPAAPFCNQFETTCGFDDSFSGQDECRAAYNGYDAEKQTCVETHLGLAESSGDTDTHCPHAAGEAPCD